MGTNSDDPPSGATGVRSKGAIRLEKRRRFYSRLLAELQKELGAKPGKGKKKIMQHHLLAMAIKWLNEHGNDEVGVDTKMGNDSYSSGDVGGGVSPWLVEDLVLLLDTQGRVLHSVNTPCNVLGIPLDGLEGRSLFELVYWTDLSRIVALFAMGVKKEERVQCRLGFKKQYHVFHLLFRPLVMGNQPCLLLSGRCLGPADDCMAVQPAGRKEQPAKWYRAWCLNTADIGVVGVWSNNSRNSVCGYPTQYVMNVSPYIYCHPEDLAGICLAVSAVVKERKVAYMCNRLYTYHNTWMMTENIMYPCINRRTGELEYYMSEGIHTDALSTFPMTSRAHESRALEGQPIYYDTVDELIERIDKLVLQAGDEFQRVADACERVEEELILTEHTKLAATLNPCRRDQLLDPQKPAVLSQILDRYQSPPCLLPPVQTSAPVLADTARIRLTPPNYANMPQIFENALLGTECYTAPENACLSSIDGAPMKQPEDALFGQNLLHAIGGQEPHVFSEELRYLETVVSSQIQTQGYRVTNFQTKGSGGLKDTRASRQSSADFRFSPESTANENSQRFGWRNPPPSTLGGSLSDSAQSYHALRHTGLPSTNKSKGVHPSAPMGLDLASVLANDAVLDAFLTSEMTNSMAGLNCSHGSQGTCSCPSTPGSNKPSERSSDWVSPARDADIILENSARRKSDPNMLLNANTMFGPSRIDAFTQGGNMGPPVNPITNGDAIFGASFNFNEGHSLAPASRNYDAALALLREIDVTPQELEALLSLHQSFNSMS
eukprot:comp22534_c0_seq1/m.34218 comp22534_c0_seq1/g.34218  ORF comp22534_c0_seq1/g.34218 comp22534_c0_seq1/m.34218 type:complete len:776 (-) comp22534_c0_seq1:107-2434(-)